MPWQSRSRRQVLDVPLRLEGEAMSDHDYPFDKPRNDLPYDVALHGVQAGAALEIAQANAGLPDALLRALKHLRVGIDSAMVNDAAMARLLVKRGIITGEAYIEEIRLEANRELDRYEARLSEAYGRKVTLR
jgi:hypothetical protein